MLNGGGYEQRTQGIVRHSRRRETTYKLVYGLGNAALAKALGYEIDEQKYKEAGFIVSRLGYKPWDLPKSAEPVLAKLMSEKERDLVSYYFDPEVRSAIDAASQAKAAYFTQFPGINQFLKDCKNVAEQRGYIKYWTGRRRHLKNPKRDGYKAPNSLIQGG